MNISIRQLVKSQKPFFSNYASSLVYLLHAVLANTTRVLYSLVGPYTTKTKLLCGTRARLPVQPRLSVIAAPALIVRDYHPKKKKAFVRSISTYYIIILNIHHLRAWYQRGGN